MSTYIIRRLLQATIILFGLSIFFFLILHLTPGGPCSAFEGAGPKAQVQYKACRERMHLDEPLVSQYVAFVREYSHGNLGYSLDGTPITQVILQRLPATILLATVSYFFQLLIALPLGILGALRQYSFFDTTLTFMSYVGLSMPTFWLGIMLLYLFGVHWPIFPLGKIESVNIPIFWSNAWWHALSQNPPLVLGDLASHLVLPCITLMVVGIAADSRFMRASMLDVIHQDYIRTAKAKGLRRRVVIMKHAFRNAILPIITNIALYLPALVGGFVITETIFSWNGLGFYFIQSIQDSNYAFLQAFLMLSALAVLMANLLADLTYAWVDPRIRYD